MKRKRILAVLTVLTMLIGLLPTTAFAEKTVSTLADLRNYLGQSTGCELITLTADITLRAADASIDVFNGNHTLDLNGYVIKREGGSGSIFNLTSTHTMTIEDSYPTAEHVGYVDENGLWHLGDAPNGETPVTIYGGIITGGNNEANTGGGAISFANLNPNLIINGGNIVGNYSQCGGAIYVKASTQTCSLTMNGGSIAYNTGDVGGVYLATTKSTLKLNGGSIEHNTGKTVGGIYVPNSTSSTLVTIDGGSISYNTGEVGGIYSCSVIEMNDGTISHNTGLQGGGIKFSGQSFTMNGGEISYNTAKCENGKYGNGGGIYTCDGTTLDLYPDASIDNNYAENDGGGLFTDGATYIGCSVENNTAGHDGGGIYMNEQYSWNGCYMGQYDWDKDCVHAGSVKNNTAGNNGGGIYVNKARFEFIKGSVENNTAGNNGGGIYAVGSNEYDFLLKYTDSPEETECLIEGNSAANDGGGMYLDATEEYFRSACITYATIDNNTCGGNGAGVAFMSKEGDVDIDTMYDLGADIGKLLLYGTPVINNNKTTKNVPSNLYFNVPNKLSLFNSDDWAFPEDGMDVGVTIAGDTKTLNYDAGYMDIYSMVCYGDSYERSECIFTEYTEKEVTYDLDEMLPYLHSDNVAYKIEHTTASDEGIDDWEDSFTVLYHYYDMTLRDDIPFFDFGEGSAPDFGGDGIPTSIPECEGLAFEGWFTEKDGGVLVNDGTDFKNGYSEYTIRETYYAHWAKAGGVAKIGEDQYETLAEAVLAAVANGEVITLLKDNSEDIYISKDQSFELDTNDFTFEGTVTTDGESEGYEVDEVTINGITIYTSSLPYIRASVANNEGDCSVTVHPFGLYSALFVAGYKGGRLVSLEQDDPEDGKFDDGIETYNFDSELDGIKIFALDLEDSLKPLCNAKVILQGEWE